MWLDLSGDLRTAFRMLQRNPGTSSLIVATLALAIGAATIGFAFADFVLLRGLPVDDNSKVVTIFASDTHGSTFRGRVSAPDLLDYRARTTTLDHLSGMREGRAALIRNGQSLTLTVSYATANVFAAMGQTPLAGRALREGDDVAGAEPVTVLSHHYWRDEMGSRADAIGKTLQIGREVVTIVGVLKPDIEFGNIAEIDLWLPQQLNPAGPRDVRNLRFMGRLREGVTFDQAAAEMAAIGDALGNEYPLTNGGWKLRLVPIREITGGDGFWIVMALFMFSMGLLIAIATANVSNLIMVRAAARARELAVRTAMGAKGGRLFRQFLVEGFVLAAIGALLSVPVAWTGLQLISTQEPAFQQIVIDGHELAFVALLALICPVVFSLASARLIVRPDLREVLATQGGRGSTAKMRGRGALVIAQVALAVIMLTASSLALKSIRAAFGQPLGMTIDRLLIFGMEFNDAVYPDPAAARAAATATRDALSAMAGVTRVTAVNALPVLGDFGPIAITVDDRASAPGESTPMAVVTGAHADAGAALGVGLRAGRWWIEGSTNEAVISQTTAMRYFDGVERAIGRHLTIQPGAHGPDRKPAALHRGNAALRVERLRDHRHARWILDRRAAAGDERTVRRGVVHRGAADAGVRHPHGARRRRVGCHPPGRAAVARTCGDRTDRRPGGWRRGRLRDGPPVVPHLARGSRDDGGGGGAADAGLTARDGAAGVAGIACRSGDCPARRINTPAMVLFTGGSRV
jgi:putative ABC transport system permease protein